MEVNIKAKEVRHKTVKAISNVGHVYLPADWVGKDVIVVLEDEKMEKIEKSVILRYKNVEIKAKVEMNDEDVMVYFWNQNNGQWNERVDQVFSGWSFQEDSLNEDMEQLIKFIKEMDEQWFADADEGEVLLFDENGYISS